MPRSWGYFTQPRSPLCVTETLPREPVQLSHRIYISRKLELPARAKNQTLWFVHTVGWEHLNLHLNHELKASPRKSRTSAKGGLSQAGSSVPHNPSWTSLHVPLSHRRGNFFFPVKGHLDIYYIICRPYKMIALTMRKASPVVAPTPGWVFMY